MENQISLGKQWLEQLLAHMGLAADVTTEGFEKVDNNLESHWLNIQGSDLSDQQKQQLIGDRGKGIDAIQYLANIMLNLNLEPEAQSSFTIELDGYRVERTKELADLTQSAIAQVRQTGKEVEIPNLSAAERKQIHTALEQLEDIASESKGREPDRRLVLKPQ